MIIEYSNGDEILVSSKSDPRSQVVIPRKNELVDVQGQKYYVEDIHHEPEHPVEEPGYRPYTTHKVTVQLGKR